MTMPPNDASSLQHAKEWLREQVKSDGANCPCCGQFAKVYKRRIHTTIVRSLIKVYRLSTEGNDGWVHVPTAISPACEVGKARYWELIEEAKEQRPDGGRAGWWRITAEGVDWLNGVTTVPCYAYIYNSNLLKLGGPPTTAAQALGNKFNLAELMGRE